MTTTGNLEPNVTTEQGLRALAEEGHTVEVLCKHLVAWVAEIGEEARPDMLKVAANATQVQR